MAPNLIFHLGYIMLTDFELGSFGLSKRAHTITLHVTFLHRVKHLNMGQKVGRGSTGALEAKMEIQTCAQTV